VRSDRERRLDILEAIERIEAQAARGRSAFARDELAQTADLDLIWSVARNDLPKLEAQIRGLVEELA
jgi:uncharacterized protein with HEPN domain